MAPVVGEVIEGRSNDRIWLTFPTNPVPSEPTLARILMSRRARWRLIRCKLVGGAYTCLSNEAIGNSSNNSRSESS